MSEQNTPEATPPEAERSVTVPCHRCGQLATITGDAAKEWRPGAVVRHGEGLCPGDPLPEGWVYELDFVIRVRPHFADEDLVTVSHDEAVAASDVLARVTKRSDARHVNGALEGLVVHLDDMWNNLTKFVGMADDARIVEAVEGRAVDPAVDHAVNEDGTYSPSGEEPAGG